MPQGHAQTEETKKKISEALKKGGHGSPTQSPESRKLTNGFNMSKSLETSSTAKIDELRKKAEKIPKGKKGKAAREAIAKQVKAEAAKVKTEREKQKGLKEQAMKAKALIVAQKNIEHATAAIQKSEQALKKADLLQANANALFEKVSKLKTTNKSLVDPKTKLTDALARIEASRQRQRDTIEQSKQRIVDANKTIKGGGITTKKSMFDFSGHTQCELLAEKKKFTIWRTLSSGEKKVDYQVLNDIFDEKEGDLEVELTEVIAISLGYSLIKMANKIKALDITGIAAMTMVSAPTINATLNKYIKASYEKGKVTASKELKTPNPVTPTMQTQLMNLDSSMIAEAMAAEIDLTAKQKAKDGIVKGVGAVAIVAAVSAATRDKASKMIVNVVGNVVGENINKGRRLVFEKNIQNIKAYQRSEILDGRTCEMCMSLDERLVSVDDPMAQLDEVHNNCRGVWIPVLQDEEMPSDTVGLPASITNAFDTIGGAPTVNSFKQLKKAINPSNQNIQTEIKRRLNANNGFDKKFGK